ncbi:MAG: threonine synthase [Alphaproteobacteria bacterium]|nr:threonine synthase [Alphaproteobacteria bacterium]
MNMRFHSTRGLAPETDLRGVALSGLAPDGGLYLPKIWPQFSTDDLHAMRGETYQQIAFRVLRPFMQGAMPEDILRGIIEKSYAAFDAAEVTPMRKLGADCHLLELFHGPTLAFKDVALQFLGHCFEYFLQDSGRHLTIVGATSGDTGSAAIAALANRKNIDVFILYPDKGPSEIQRRQMTCVDAANVHALAVTGTFDDCQGIVKALFADARLREEENLSTVNSINWLRIMAQIVYYFVAAQKVEGKPTFVVPTGNFGDVFAGYAAMKCGLPVGKLVVASNRNDILTRFFATGRMSPQGVKGTLSPSMDIQISSNFERLLFDLCGQDAKQVRGLMCDLKDKNGFSVSDKQLRQAQEIFVAGRADDEETLATIADVYDKYGYVLDPHTAVGVKVARDLALPQPVICLGTAHPAKFPDTIQRAIGLTPSLPAKTAILINKPERTILLPASTERVVAFMRERKKS